MAASNENHDGGVEFSELQEISSITSENYNTPNVDVEFREISPMTAKENLDSQEGRSESQEIDPAATNGLASPDCSNTDLPPFSFTLCRQEARSKFGNTHWFVPFSIVSFLLCFAEPVLIGYRPHGLPRNLQVVVMALSTLWVYVGMYAVAQQLDSANCKRAPIPGSLKGCITGMTKLSGFDVELFFQYCSILIDGDVLVELGCLVFGWCTFFDYYGIAALRCFRIFRISWYEEIYKAPPLLDFDLFLEKREGFHAVSTTVNPDQSVDNDDGSQGDEVTSTHAAPGSSEGQRQGQAQGNRYKSVSAPASSSPLRRGVLERMFRVLQREAAKISYFLVNIEAELFWKNSKGSLIILSAYFYTTYLVSIVMWNRLEGMSVEGNPDDVIGNSESCHSRKSCFIIMMRLSLYDGYGFNFLQQAMDNGYGGLTLIMILYLIVTAIILLNGLTGIFGDMFSTDDDEADEAMRKELESVLTVIGNDASTRKNPLDIWSPRASTNAEHGRKRSLSLSMRAQDTLDSKCIHPHSACVFKFSERWYFWPLFLASSALACIEPVLVGFRPQGTAYNLQKAVLAVSTALFIVINILIVLEYDGAMTLLKRNYETLDLKGKATGRLSAKEEMSHNVMSKHLSHYIEIIKKYEDTNWKYMGIVDHMRSGEIIFELLLLIFGWATIFNDPGISALRCFRAIRMLWYVHLFNPKEDEGKVGFAFVNNQVCLYAASTVKLCVHYLEKLTKEVPGKGALAVLFMFFYITYVIMVVFWNEESQLENVNGFQCGNPQDCFITLLRLCFYDSNGFDFLTSTMNTSHPALSGLLILYMVFGSMVLLNGLIGIFGATFSTGVETNENSAEYFDANVDAKSFDMLRFIKQFCFEVEDYLADIALCPDDELPQKLKVLRQKLSDSAYSQRRRQLQHSS